MQEISDELTARDFVNQHIKPSREVFNCFEISCGWVCEWDSPEWVENFGQFGEGRNGVIGAALGPILVNRWTREIREINLAIFPNLEAAIRDYVRELPIEQQQATMARQAIGPYSMVRFDPPFLDIGVIPTFTAIPSVEFQVTAEAAILAEYKMTFPQLETGPIPNVKELALKETWEGDSGDVTARYTVIFDYEAVKKYFGHLGNRYYFSPPEGSDLTPIKEEYNQNCLAPGYWLYIQGRVDDLSLKRLV